MKTTKAHFDLFKKEFLRWVDKLGLKGWNFYFQHVAREKTNACILPPDKLEVRNITVCLNTDVDEEEINMKRLALHEALEVLLLRLSFIAACRFCQQEEIDEERHHIIMTLEKVLL